MRFRFDGYSVVKRNLHLIETDTVMDYMEWNNSCYLSSLCNGTVVDTNVVDNTGLIFAGMILVGSLFLVLDPCDLESAVDVIDKHISNKLEYLQIICTVGV